MFQFLLTFFTLSNSKYEVLLLLYQKFVKEKAFFPLTFERGVKFNTKNETDLESETHFLLNLLGLRRD